MDATNEDLLLHMQVSSLSYLFLLSKVTDKSLYLYPDIFQFILR